MNMTSAVFGLLFATQKIVVNGPLNAIGRNEKMKVKATTIGKWYEKDTFSVI